MGNSPTNFVDPTGRDGEPIVVPYDSESVGFGAPDFVPLVNGVRPEWFTGDWSEEDIYYTPSLRRTKP